MALGDTTVTAVVVTVARACSARVWAGAVSGALGASPQAARKLNVRAKTDSRTARMWGDSRGQGKRQEDPHPLPPATGIERLA
jgi:hypothetical protein